MLSPSTVDRNLTLEVILACYLILICPLDQRPVRLETTTSLQQCGQLQCNNRERTETLGSVNKSTHIKHVTMFLKSSFPSFCKNDPIL